LNSPDDKHSLAWFAAAQILLNEINKEQPDYQQLELD
jgi:hypothetical protein